MLGNSSWFATYQNETLLDDETSAMVSLTDMCTHGIPFINWNADSYSDGYSQSFVDARQWCSQLSYFFSRPSLVSSRDRMSHIAYEWFGAFNDTGYVNRSLAAGMYYGNQVTLDRVASSDGFGTYRQVNYAPGALLTKPSLSLPPKILVSLFLGLEVLAIMGLLVFIYRTPTFADRLDAVTVAILGAHLFSPGHATPQLSGAGMDDLNNLESQDGLIGVNNGGGGGIRETNDTSRTTGPTREGVSGEDGALPTFEDIELEDRYASQLSRGGNVPTGSLVLGGTGLLPHRDTPVKPAEVRSGGNM